MFLVVFFSGWGSGNNAWFAFRLLVFRGNCCSSWRGGFYFMALVDRAAVV